MKEVDADLYEFLKNNETTIFKENGKIRIVIFVDFDDLNKLVEVIGTYYFDEKGLEVVMRDNYLCIPIKDHIKGCGHKISSYEDCFESDVWKRYSKKIEELEKEGE